MSDDHKKFELIVNGKPKPWDQDTINYTQVVDLAYPPPHGQNEVFTVQYSHGPRENSHGTVVDGQTTNVKSGMRFDVVRTNKS
jgi:hypothetical protein